MSLGVRMGDQSDSVLDLSAKPSAAAAPATSAAFQWPPGPPVHPGLLAMMGHSTTPYSGPLPYPRILQAGDPTSFPAPITIAPSDASSLKEEQEEERCTSSPPDLDSDGSGTSSSTQRGRKRRSTESIEELRDALYRERRMKNNEAAKRSRDSRRQKGEYTEKRLRMLEQEHLELNAQIQLLRQENHSLKLMILRSDQ